MMFPEVPFLDRFEAAANAGFDAVEFAFPYEYKATDLKARLDDNGMHLVLFNTAQGDIPAGERGIAALKGRESEFRAAVNVALEYADLLGAPLIHVMAGIVSPSDTQEAATIFRKNLSWVAENARSANVELVIEPINHRDIPGYFLNTQAQGAKVVSDIGNSSLGLLFDLYHCQVTEGDITKRMEHHLPAIKHMQVADAPGRNEPGTGELNWDFVFGKIAELGYAGFIGCEYRPTGDTMGGLSWRTRYAV